MSKKKVQMSVRWYRDIYDLAVTVSQKMRRSVGWILMDWARKGAISDGHKLDANPDAREETTDIEP